MRTYDAVGQVDPESESTAWSLVDDPAALRRFASALLDRHHRVVQPGAVADQCSCGRPFMLCSIAPLADSLVDRALS